PLELERRLIELTVAMLRPSTNYRLIGSQNAAFAHLAGAITRASRLWTSARVLFLLDDVSTRYLAEERVRQLIALLLFSDPTCAFKITTEAQTHELVLRPSSDRPEVAMPGRDYDIFDLGADVHRRMRHRGSESGGKAFL